MKKRITYRFVASLVLSAMLFTVPVTAYALNKNITDEADDLVARAEPEADDDGTTGTAAEQPSEMIDSEGTVSDTVSKGNADDPENLKEKGYPGSDNDKGTDRDQNTGDADNKNDTGDEPAEPDKYQEKDTGEETGDVNDDPAGNNENKDEQDADPQDSQDKEEETEEPGHETCICDKKCTPYEFNIECPVCSKNTTKCMYEEPDVKITINAPAGWYPAGTGAIATFKVEDIANSGHFDIKSVKAKIGQNGSYTDVTEDMCLEISENCTIYVLVTDARNIGYERNRSIKCFDTTKPTLNAAVSEGLLTVQAVDSDSGVQIIYINGYEFRDMVNGTLNVRLAQFDAGYEYFTIQAMDSAGNMSEVYKTKNPYYKDPSSDDNEDPSRQLPASAQATKPASATAVVTEHTETAGDGITGGMKTRASSSAKGQTTTEPRIIADIGNNDSSDTVIRSASEIERSGNTSNEVNDAAVSGDKYSGEAMNAGKEFYTIEAASGKVFYLIIDRDGEEQVVHFLTDITENDLLNVTQDNSETLPRNSAALDSGIPITESALPNNNSDPGDTAKVIKPAEDSQELTDESAEPAGEDDSDEGDKDDDDSKKDNKNGAGIVILIILAVGITGAAAYLKVFYKRNDEDFVEDEDEDDEDTADYNEEPVPDGNTEDQDDFFDDDEDSDIV